MLPVGPPPALSRYSEGNGTMHHNGMNFATKDEMDFAYIYLSTVKLDKIPFSIIKGDDFDYFEITRKLK